VQTLHGVPVAWSAGTQGRVRAPVILVDAQSPEDLAARYAGTLRDKFVVCLCSISQQRMAAGDLPAPSDLPPFRLPLDSLVGPRVFDLEVIAQDSAREAERRRQIFAQFRPLQRLSQAVGRLALQEGAAGWLSASGYGYGLIEHYGDPAADARGLVDVTVMPEQWGQIVRNLRREIPVEVELEVENRFYSDDLNAHNTFGELRGQELPDEYVVIGAHLDSWHSGTGATDNAAGASVVLEAMRILQTLNVPLRRTIRVALWSGEEQGLLGSAGWLAQNEAMHLRISAYLNIDYGTGRIRGIDTGGSDAARSVFEQILWPFRDLGVVGVRDANLGGGSDDSSFTAAGIPAFSFIQDPLGYWDLTHHLSVDTFERLALDDLKQAAVVIAATAYHLATRDEPMPRE
jgi:hypothetical protein